MRRLQAIVLIFAVAFCAGSAAADTPAGDELDGLLKNLSPRDDSFSVDMNPRPRAASSPFDKAVNRLGRDVKAGYQLLNQEKTAIKQTQLARRSAPSPEIKSRDDRKQSALNAYEERLGDSGRMLRNAHDQMDACIRNPAAIDQCADISQRVNDFADNLEIATHNLPLTIRSIDHPPGQQPELPDVWSKGVMTR